MAQGLKIAYFVRDNGACAYYRVVLPLETYGSKNGTRVISFGKGDSTENLEAMLNSDIIVIPRVREEEFINLIPRLQAEGKKVVVDHDDDIFSISPFNPAYEDYGTEEVFILLNGESMPLWIDQRKRLDFTKSKYKPNFVDLEFNRNRLRAFENGLRHADMVTVTTPLLADAYTRYNRNVKALPNCVDMSLWKKPEFKERDTIRLYWSGGASHYEDWVLLAEVLPEVMKKYPQTVLVILGQKFDGTLKEIPRDRFEFYPWVATPAYPYRTALLDPDICLIPLKETDFSQCKSPIKWVEMGALEIPCVASLVSPYKEIATEENGVFIENNDPQAWLEGISLLIEDKGLRKSVAGAAHQTVLDNFDISTQWEQWRNAYEDLA
jgi:glycosyltransferase involved in cell wall biosynthesis